MRRTWVAGTVFWMLLTTVCQIQAQGPTEAQALIDWAIAKAGGADKLTPFQAETVKGHGKHYGTGKALDYSSERSVQPPQQVRVTIDTTLNETKATLVWVLNGNKGWVKVNDSVQAMNKEMLAEEQEQYYAGRVATLLPLKDGTSELTLLGESTVGARLTVGVKVSSKGHRDVRLYFDKEVGLLLKSETLIKDIQAGGKEVAQEVSYSDFEEVGGARRPTRITVKRDGKLYVEEVITEYKPLERREESTFAKP